jgi:hypothetical protein
MLSEDPTADLLVPRIALAVRQLVDPRQAASMEKSRDSCQDQWSDAAAGSVARRSTSAMTSNRCLGASFKKAVNSRKLSTVSLDGAPSLLCSSATDVGVFMSHL